MLMLLIFVLVLFRWFILHRFLGTKRMHLFDAIMFTAFAAQNFAAVHFAALDGWGIANLAMMGLCLWWAHAAGTRFLNFDSTVANEQGKSDSGTTKSR